MIRLHEPALHRLPPWQDERRINQWILLSLAAHRNMLLRCTTSFIFRFDRLCYLHVVTCC